MYAAVLGGRILMTAMFLFSGTMKLIDVSGTAAHIEQAGLPLPSVVAVLTGLFEIGAGLMVLVGWHARIAAWLLAAFCVAAGVLFHNFWAFEGREQVAQMLNLFKNVTIAGGFIILAEYAAGRYGFDAKRGHVFDAPSGRMGMA
jgi:putative oxidoreductase